MTFNYVTAYKRFPSVKFFLTLLFVALVTFLPFPVSAQTDFTESERLTLMDREMNCISQQIHQGQSASWADTCAADMAPRRFELAKLDAVQDDYSRDDDAVVTDEGAVIMDEEAVMTDEDGESLIMANAQDEALMDDLMDQDSEMVVIGGVEKYDMEDQGFEENTAELIEDTDEFVDEKVMEIDLQDQGESMDWETDPAIVTPEKNKVQWQDATNFSDKYDYSQLSEYEYGEGDKEPEDWEYMPDENTDDGDSFFGLNNPLTTFDFGTEASFIRYAEPGIMREKGYMWGAFGSYTYRTSDNAHIKKFSDMLSDGSKVNMFRLDGNFSWGEVDYESEETGKIDDITDYLFEVRGSMGYDIPIDRVRITPYVGLGYRYLHDDTGGLTSTTGHLGYERESKYFYLPAGVETHIELSKMWVFETVFEYDFLLDGTQISHLGDAEPGIDPIKNDQNDGYGLRGSFKIIRKNKNVDFFVEPFVRYWNIENSELQNITYYGDPIGWVGLEPKNNSTEYGIKIGLRY